MELSSRGLKANNEEILLLHKVYEPGALCLQDTHLTDTDNVSIRNYDGPNGSLFISILLQNSGIRNCEVYVVWASGNS